MVYKYLILLSVMCALSLAKRPLKYDSHAAVT